MVKFPPHNMNANLLISFSLFLLILLLRLHVIVLPLLISIIMIRYNNIGFWVSVRVRALILLTSSYFALTLHCIALVKVRVRQIGKVMDIVIFIGLFSRCMCVLFVSLVKLI